jgi:3-phosphoshikimate 1-carboxyvinyltransferase
MKTIEIIPGILNGEIRIPPSKSISHRAIICSGLCEGENTIKNVLLSQDILDTCNALEALGINILYTKEDQGETNTLTIRGNPNLRPIKNIIDCGESGSTLRFLIPLATLTKEKLTFKGRGRLVKRPLDPYFEIFKNQDIPYESNNKGLPLSVNGTLHPGIYKVPGDISSQFITGLMLALPLLKGDSRIIITTPLESKGYIDLTLEMLKKFSIEVENEEYKEFYIRGNQKFKPVSYRVEGDFSQSAFWFAAGILGGKIRTTHLNINSLQGDKIIIDFIRKMAGNIIVEEQGVTTIASTTKGITIDASQCPDLVPILAVLGALTKGTTNIINAQRLRIKESDRLWALASELNKLGGRVRELEDGLIIQGVDALRGGVVDSWNDHRIAMALAIASIKCTKPVIITNSDAVKKSYPSFWQDFSRLGGRINERSMG